MWCKSKHDDMKKWVSSRVMHQKKSYKCDHARMCGTSFSDGARSFCSKVQMAGYKKSLFKIENYIIQYTQAGNNN